MAALFRNHLPSFLIAAVLLLAAARTEAANDTLRVKPLPSKQIDHVYRNGDLDSVVIYIRMGRPKPMFLDRGDSVVAFKYLGIIYSADAGTREKGRYYFNQLLMKDPRASITELLPGESARLVFKEVREEFFELYPHLAAQAGQTFAPPQYEEERTDTVVVALRSGGNREPAPTPDAKPGKKRSWTWAYITSGVIVAGGAAAVALLDPPAKTYSLND